MVMVILRILPRGSGDLVSRLIMRRTGVTIAQW